MIPGQARRKYRQIETQANIHPVKLVHLMYDRALLHLSNAEKAIQDNNPQKRGENLGKAIALITELNASVKPDDDSEAAQFLRGLYRAILVELPKVSLTNDLKTLNQAYNYISRLKEIWEQTAMRENNLTGGHPHPAGHEEDAAATDGQPGHSKAKNEGIPAQNGYGSGTSREKLKHGLSVAI